MSGSDKKIKELFRDTLLSDEEIYWLGAPLHNNWHLKGRHLFYIFAFLMMIPLGLFGIYALFVGLSLLQWLIRVMSVQFMLVVFYVGIFFIRILVEAHERRIDQPEYLGSEKVFYWWKPSYYAITSLRVLIFEQGSIRDYWYTLLDEPILKKPKHGAASIQLYSSTYAAKKKKTPVLDTLRGIPEKEADDAFAILKQAREEALKERKDKMGID